MSAPAAYAAGTTVAPERTRIEIEQLLRRNGATGFGFAEEGGRARLQFRLEELLVRFDLLLPDPDDEDLQFVKAGSRGTVRRTPAQASSACEKAVRQKWRALLLCIKAKLAAIEAGIVSVEEEFLAHVVMADGRTVGEAVHSTLALEFDGGRRPRMIEDRT